MRKILLSFTLLLLAIAAYSQPPKKAVGNQYVPVKIDSLVTVSLPAAFQRKDTLTQQIYSANSLYGFISVIRTANDKGNTPLKKEKDLNKVLNDYIKRIQSQATDGQAIRARDTTVGTLKAKNFTLRSEDDAGNSQLVNFTLIYTQDATYTFEYVFPEIRGELVKDEYKAFISSIRLSKELQRNDQYLSNAKGLSFITKIAIFGGGALVIILVIVLIVKRKKKLAIS